MAENNLHIVSGFKDDCLQLLSMFKEEDDIRFETFCKCWQEMKFSLVFLNRESFPDLLEFCEEALHIAKQFVLPPYNFKERIGGLYLIYGLYYKMPLENLVKIRLTLSDYKQLTELQQEIREGEHLDANYVLSKLFVDSAFQFCLFNKEMGLQKQVKATKKRSEEGYENQASVLPFIRQMNEPDGVLNRLKQLSKLYEDEKAMCSKLDGSNGIVKLFKSHAVDDVMLQLQKVNRTQTESQVKENPTPKKKPIKSSSKLRPVLGRGFDTSSEEETEEEPRRIVEHKVLFKTELHLPLEESSENEMESYEEHPHNLKFHNDSDDP